MDAPKFELNLEETGQEKPGPGHTVVQQTPKDVAAQLQPMSVEAHADQGIGWSQHDGEKHATSTALAPAYAPAPQPEAPQPSDFQTLGAAGTSQQFFTPKIAVYSALGLLAAAAAGFLLFGESLLQPEIAVEVLPPAEGVPKKPKPSGANMDPAAELLGSDASAAAFRAINPYWNLINPKPYAPVTKDRTWTRQDEEIYRAGMQHRFVYQQYKAVTGMRAARLKGSFVLLEEALLHPKLWTRMEAALALIEMGRDFPPRHAQRVVAGSDGAQIRKYLQRFPARRGESTAAQNYLMRALLAVVDQPTRLAILQQLSRSPDAALPLYLAAATMDPNPQIRDWSTAALVQAPGLTAPDQAHLLAFVSGQEPLNSSWTELLRHAPAKAEDIAAAVEEDLSQAELVSDVEFYTSPVAAASGDQPVVDTSTVAPDGYEELKQRWKEMSKNRY